MIDVSTVSGAFTVSTDNGVLLEKAIRHHMFANGVSFLEGKHHLGLVDITPDILETSHRALISMGWNSRMTKSDGHDQDSNLETVVAVYIKDGVILGLIIVRWVRHSDTLRVSYLITDELEEHKSKTLDIFKPYVMPQPVEINALVGFDESNGRAKLVSRKINGNDNVPLDCFYPFIEESIDDLSSNYIKSNGNLLLLMGIPGSGKTTLMRDICRRYRDRDIYQISGPTLINSPLFNPFISDLKDGSIVVIEDADELLMSRRGGNQSMSMLLNELDGIATRDVKFIMSTNLSNVSDIDEAIYRTGRCYKVINFRKLNLDEINTIASECNLDVSHVTGKSVLADVFNASPIRDEDVKSNVGFL
ncbi:MAG: hypothetical protein CL582_18665 [Alteromonadaceae bacterium]|nr:hypothetical protein [Alteromonadaceae bacterium]|tara:strand:- start:32 stop:1117 length:1086 start_codon:yes stop_codon:yes gene_type:complete